MTTATVTPITPRHTSEEKLYVYRTFPIDFWYGWTPFLEVLKDALNDEQYIPINPKELLARLQQAQLVAREQLCWDGDIRGGFGHHDGGPWVAPLPAKSGGYEFLLAWKQDDNGMTFVISPQPLQWLEQGYDPAERVCINWVKRNSYMVTGVKE